MIQSAEEKSGAEDAKNKHNKEGSDRTLGSLDTFSPLAMKEPPRSCKQDSREQGGRSPQELGVIEGDIERASP